MDVEGAYAFLGLPLYDRLRLYDAFETDFFDKTGLWSLPASRLADDIAHRRAAAFVDSKVFMSPTVAELVAAHYRKSETIGRRTLYLPRPDMAILALPRADRPGWTDGPARLEAATAQGLKDWGSYLQPQDAQQGGSLVVQIAADRPLGLVTLEAFPRFTQAGQEIRVAWSGDGATFAPLETWQYQGPPPGTGYENRREARFETKGQQVWLRFELTGTASCGSGRTGPCTSGCPERD